MANQTKKWIPIFDWRKAQASGRKDVPKNPIADVIRNFNASELMPPAIIGHYTDYPTDTRVPVGALVSGLRAVANGSVLEAQYEFPGKVEAAIPKEFQELVGFSEFFKDAVNKKLYNTRSVGIGTKPDGTAFLHHVGYLGAQVPAIKGMAPHEFSQLPDEAHSHFIEYGDASGIVEFSETTMKDFSQIKFPSSVSEEKQLKYLRQAVKIKAKSVAEFAEDDPNETLIDVLQDLWGLDDSTTVEEIVGIAKKLLSQKDEDAAAAMGAAGLAFSRTYADTVKTVELKEFAEKLGGVLGEMETRIVSTLEKKFSKLKQFDDATANGGNLGGEQTDPNSATAGGSNNGGSALAPAPASLGLTVDAVSAAVQTAQNTLTNGKNWIPSFDSSLTPLMGTLANTKFGEMGSALDALVQALSAVEGLAEMKEHMTQIQSMFEMAEERSKDLRTMSDKPTDPVRVPVDKHGKELATESDNTITFNDRHTKIVEFMQKNPTVTYLEADEKVPYED